MHVAEEQRHFTKHNWNVMRGVQLNRKEWLL